MIKFLAWLKRLYKIPVQPQPHLSSPHIYCILCFTHPGLLAILSSVEHTLTSRCAYLLYLCLEHSSLSYSQAEVQSLTQVSSQMSSHQKDLLCLPYPTRVSLYSYLLFNFPL